MNTQLPPLGIEYRPGAGALVVAAGTQVLLGPSLIGSAPQLLRGLLSRANPRELLNAVCAQAPDEAVAATIVTPNESNFLARGGARIIAATPRGEITELPELPAQPGELTGWLGGKLAAVAGWRIGLCDTSSEPESDAPTTFVSAGGVSPAGEAWFGQVATFGSTALAAPKLPTASQPEPESTEESEPEPATVDEVTDDEVSDETILDPAPPASSEAAPDSEPVNDETILDPVPVSDETLPDAPSYVSISPVADHGSPPTPAGETQADPASETPSVAAPDNGAQQSAAKANAAAEPALPPLPPLPRSDEQSPFATAASTEASPGAQEGASLERPREREADFVPRLVSNHGHTVALECTHVIGRKPRVDRAPDPQKARLIVVPSPKDEISRSHCVVTFDGGNVLVWDLGSANGTRVLRGGSIPEQLSPMISVTIAHGDIIDLGDGATFWID